MQNCYTHAASHMPLFATKLLAEIHENKKTNKNSLTIQMSRHGRTDFTDCTAVRHKSLNKSVSTHGRGLSNVAYSKHFIHSAAISELFVLKFFLAHETTT